MTTQKYDIEWQYNTDQDNQVKKVTPAYFTREFKVYDSIEQAQARATKVISTDNQEENTRKHVALLNDFNNLILDEDTVLGTGFNYYKKIQNRKTWAAALFAAATASICTFGIMKANQNSQPQENKAPTTKTVVMQPK